MRIEEADLFFLHIPFRLAITHGARSNRNHSDSIVVRLRAGNTSGYGETVFREYVSGPIADNPREEGIRIATALARSVLGRELSWEEAAERASAVAADAAALPMLCAVETAILDLACKIERRDIFDLLGRQGTRQIVTYGGTIPLLSPPEVERFAEEFVAIGLPDLKVKVGPNPETNRQILAACRRAAGAERTIRVDANGCWSVANLDDHLDVCSQQGVLAVEQPLLPATPGADEALRQARSRGFSFMADEGFRSGDDLHSLAVRGAYSMVNLRLAKNGGLRRVLALAGQAEELGLGYQLGCMVGETGILSALGRAAAAMLPAPRWVEGGYDDLLLMGNVTTESFGFGTGGRAPVLRGAGIGYTVDDERLARLSVSRLRLR